MFTTPGQLHPPEKGAALQMAPTRAHPVSAKFTDRHYVTIVPGDFDKDILPFRLQL